MSLTRPRHVLITGGSRGIGLSIAQLFASKGYRCTLISRSEEALKSAVSSLTPLPSGNSESGLHDHPSNLDNHAYIAGDITQYTQFWSLHPTRALSAVLPRPTPSKSRSSCVDVLVNCAGVAQKSLFLQTSHDEVENIVAVNLTSMMHGTRFLMRNGYLRGAKSSSQQERVRSPSVINVSSLFGLHGGFGAVSYAASKAGVLGFTRALASEYASHRVRVNAIVPGYIATDMTSDLDASELEKKIPLGRIGKPEEVASAALFLAENEYAHNCVLGIDGGLSAV